MLQIGIKKASAWVNRCSLHIYQSNRRFCFL